MSNISRDKFEDAVQKVESMADSVKKVCKETGRNLMDPLNNALKNANDILEGNFVNKNTNTNKSSGPKGP